MLVIPSERTRLERFLRFINEELPSVALQPSSNTTDVMPLQLSNALLPTLVHPLGMMISPAILAFLYADEPMLVTLLGRMRFVAGTYEKAALPMLVTAVSFSKTTLVKLLQFSNTLFGMDVITDEIVTLVIAVSLNADEPRLVIVLGISTFSFVQ